MRFTGKKAHRYRHIHGTLYKCDGEFGGLLIGLDVVTGTTIAINKLKIVCPIQARYVEAVDGADVVDIETPLKQTCEGCLLEQV